MKLLAAVGVAAAALAVVAWRADHGNAAAQSVRPSAQIADVQRSLEGRIAFSLGSSSDDQDIYVVDADGTGLRRLTSHPDSEFDPTWSPDGRRIAYRRQDEQSGQIYVMNADGSRQRNLTRRRGLDYSPAWSPDGRRIAFGSVRAGRATIWVMRPDGSDRRRLNRVYGEYPAWSPDGRKIAFDHISSGSTGWDIWVMNADGSGARPLIASEASEQGPAWSPDGATIAYQSDRGAPARFKRIWLANADGSRQRRLTPHFGERPVWSRDGELVLFTWDRLFVVRRDGSGLKALPARFPGEPILADWSRR